MLYKLRAATLLSAAPASLQAFAIRATALLAHTCCLAKCLSICACLHAHLLSRMARAYTPKWCSNGVVEGILLRKILYFRAFSGVLKILPWQTNSILIIEFSFLKCRSLPHFDAVCGVPRQYVFSTDFQAKRQIGAKRGRL